MRRSLSLALCMGLSWSSVALAQTNKSMEEPRSQWSAGIFAASVQKVYRGFDRDNIAFPMVSYENKWVSVGLPRVDYKAYADDLISFRLRARYANDGYDDNDSPFLAGMHERKGSVWIGGAVILKTPIANVSAELLGDALGNSKGVRGSVQAERRFGFGPFGLTPRLGAEWYDSKFVDYYYGVQASEANAVRAAYQGRSTVAIESGLRLDFSFSRKDTVLLSLGFTHYGSAIEDSPIVEKATQTSLGLGYLHRF